MKYVYFMFIYIIHSIPETYTKCFHGTQPLENFLLFGKFSPLNVI